MMLRKESWLIVVLCAAGCGGGQGSDGGDAALHTASAGGAVFTYSGQPKPMATSSSSQVTVLSQAGATFSTVTLEPAPNLADTYFVFTRNDHSAYQLYSFPYGSSSAQILYQSALGVGGPAISPYGEVLFNLLGGDDSSTGVAYSVRPDGTGFKQLSFSNGLVYDGAFSNDGTDRVAYFGDPGLWIAPATGGTATKIQNIAFVTAAWSPSGTQIAYMVPTGTDNNTDVYLTSTSGGTATDITPTSLKNTGFFSYPTWSPDGVTLAATYLASSGGTNEIVKFAFNNPTAYQVITPSGDNDWSPTYSPDGSKIAFYRASDGGATPGIYNCDSGGENTQLILQDPADDTNSLGAIQWSPFLPKETVVSATGSTFYHSAASGWLLSEIGPQFGSLVAFTAKTPSSATIATPTVTAGSTSPLVFTINADSLTGLAYTNSYFSPGTTITLSSTPTAVVSIDAVTGQVDLVAPAAKATSQMSGSNVVYSGKFKALYDKAGKNLAPSGASQITLDSKSGKLVSFK